MSNHMPIYSQVVPKSQYRKSKPVSTRERPQNLARTDFDPLNYNHGGNFQLLNAPLEVKMDKEKKEKRGDREKDRGERDRERDRDRGEARRKTQRVDTNDGKVEAYLRQNQMSIRQQQHRHSAVRQAEHRVNLRSLPLNENATARGHDRTPTDRHRGFPEREREGREHRRERNKDRDRERDRDEFDGFPEREREREPREHRRERDKDRDRDRERDFELDGTPLTPPSRPVRKSSSSARVSEAISADKRRFFCREWAFQKIAHCLEQRPVSKTCGALILGDAGSGKTALCQELSEPGQGPQARQQRALNRRLLARHFLQGHNEGSLRPGEFIRSLAMQILSQSSRRPRADTSERDLSPKDCDGQNSEEERLINRFQGMGDDGEESSKPLLADSEDQRTDDEEVTTRRVRTIDRIHERDAYTDLQLERDGDSALDRDGDDAPDKEGDEQQERDGNTDNTLLMSVHTDQRTDDEEITRTIDRIHERDAYTDLQLERDGDSALDRDGDDAPDKEGDEQQERDGNTDNTLLMSVHTDQRTDDEEITRTIDRIHERDAYTDLQLERDGDSALDRDGDDAPDKEGDEQQERDGNTDNTLLMSVHTDQRTDDEEITRTIDRIHERDAYTDLQLERDGDSALDRDGDDAPDKEGDEQQERDGNTDNTLLMSVHTDQRTDDEEITRTIDRIHERDAYTDLQLERDENSAPDRDGNSAPDRDGNSAPDKEENEVRDGDGNTDNLPEILPRSSVKPTNPFATEEHENPLYENHENVFLRNISQRQSKEIRNSRLLRQSSEPLTGRKASVLQKSLSTEQKTDSENEKNSPPKSRIPVSNFKYPNKSELKPNSIESSPQKKEELPEYQNVLKEVDDPPPIPSLPVSPRTLIANAYYDKLLSEPEIQQALLPHNLEKNPDECFKKALLFPLLEIDPPKQCLFLLVDGIDAGMNGQASDRDSTECARTVATLLSRHQHLFPQWLLLVCCARRHCKGLTSMFTGFRKITLDELQRAHVSADVQRYVLSRLDTEPRLRARVSHDATAAAAAAAALDHLRIKSDGCLLYLEKVLDGVADGFIALREIKEIPGTLNGLYLWLAQRLFHGRRFTKVRLLLDVLLAARCGVTEEMLYKCLLTKEYSVTREDFNRRLHLLRRILVMERATGYLSIFHHSFSAWLVDVKHCTRRYLCCPADGHAALAMYYTLLAKRLSALEIHNYVFHMTSLEQHMAAQKKKTTDQDEVIDLHTLVLLWVLDSGCDVESALRRETDTMRQLETIDTQKNESKTEDQDGDPESEGKDSISDPSALESIMPELISGNTDARWPRDRRVLRALLELSRSDSAPGETTEEVPDLLSLDAPLETELEPALEPEEPVVEPNAVFELASRGEDEALSALLKRCPSLALVTDVSGGTALHSAARAGRAGAAAALLRAGARADAPDADAWSPLRAAAWAGHTEVVEVLLEFGCDVDCVDADNRTALRAAAWSGHECVVSRLLAAGADPDKADAEGRTPLIAAAYMGHADIVRALLDAGASVDHADEDGRTALSVASLCASGAACAALLLERGADVSRCDRDRATPLLVAAFEGHTEICELLLEHEADIEAHDVLGRTALWAAASAGHARATRLLLFWGACVDSMDREGRTVLTTAAAQGNVEVVRQLLDRGLDEHHRDNSGWTPLHYAAFEGHVEVCEALLEAGAKVDEADNDGKGALMLAAQEGHTALVEVLVDDWAAPVDQRAHDGKTALRLAALEGHFDCVLALHQRGADADALDADRRSALYVLALDNRLAMARFLLTECNASATTTDLEGRTPLHVSAWQGHVDMVNLLIKVGGADVDGRDRCGRTALHAAAWRGRGAVLAALLARGADTAAVCTQGATPLGIAAQEGHEECVLWLLQHGADPLQADHCGRTPATVAWRAGHAHISRLLERAAPPPAEHSTKESPEYKRRSVHSASTRSSASRDHEPPDITHHEKPNRANLSLSFAQQVARCGRSRREKERENVIPENHAVEKDSKLRSYAANERDADIRGYACERDRRRDERHGYPCDRDNMSPLYASPPRSPISDICSPTQPHGSQPPSLTTQPVLTDTHFNRDTHMRIILGRENKPQERESKGKRNGIVTNPAMRLVANVRNGLDSAAANIRRTGVALAASASSNNPAVKTNAFQWRKETPL